MSGPSPVNRSLNIRRGETEYPIHPPYIAFLDQTSVPLYGNKKQSNTRLPDATLNNRKVKQEKSSPFIWSIAEVSRTKLESAFKNF